MFTGQSDVGNRLAPTSTRGGSGTPGKTQGTVLSGNSSPDRLILTQRRVILDEGGISGAHVSLDVLCAVLEGADPRAHSAPTGEFRDGEFVQTQSGRGFWAQREKLEHEYRRDFAKL